MTAVFDIGIILFLLLMLYRLILFSKDKRRQKKSLSSEFSKEGVKKYGFLVIFEFIMYILWSSVFLYFIYFFFIY